MADEPSEQRGTGTKPVISDAAAAGQIIKSLHLTQLPLLAYPPAGPLPNPAISS